MAPLETYANEKKKAEYLLCLINQGMLSCFYGCFDV